MTSGETSQQRVVMRLPQPEKPDGDPEDRDHAERDFAVSTRPRP
jgi:hypothetical protein